MFDRMRASRDMHSSLCTARCSVPLSRCTRITSQRLRIVAGARNLSGRPDACQALRGAVHTTYRSHGRSTFTLWSGICTTQCEFSCVVATERRISLHIVSSYLNNAIARSRVAYTHTIAAIQRVQSRALSLQRDLGAAHLSLMRDRAIASRSEARTDLLTDIGRESPSEAAHSMTRACTQPHIQI